MSEGPIKREREASSVAKLPRMPKLGDVVILDPAPLGRTHWEIVWVPSSALGPSDVVTLHPVDKTCPVGMTRRRVSQLRPAGEGIEK